MDYFLRKADYFSLIEEDELDAIIEDRTGVPTDIWLTERMLSAVEEAASYLSHKYNTAQIFAPIPKWDTAPSYDTGQGVVIYYEPNNLTYQPTALNSNQNPIDFPGLWEEIPDPRSQLIKKVVTDMAIYDINTRLNPRNIPEVRMNRRDEAERWLNRISKGQINAGNLPTIDPEEDQAGRILFGGETKTQNSF